MTGKQLQSLAKRLKVIEAELTEMGIVGSFTFGNQCVEFSGGTKDFRSIHLSFQARFDQIGNFKLTSVPDCMILELPAMKYKRVDKALELVKMFIEIL